MPELPDLQVFSTNLKKKLKNKTITHVSVPVTRKLKVTINELSRKVKGKKVADVYREGKELRLLLSDKTRIGMHLMLHGNLVWADSDHEVKHIIAQFSFNDGTVLALTDWQKSANITLNPVDSEVPDALSNTFSLSYLLSILDSKRRVKDILMDQKKVRGIGNAYADEILWQARIAPSSVGEKIPKQAVSKLHKAITQVLTKAEKHINKVRPGTITGELRDFLLIHNAERKLSPNGAPLRVDIRGGRKTYYTDEQQMYN